MLIVTGMFVAVTISTISTVVYENLKSGHVTKNLGFPLSYMMKPQPSFFIVSGDFHNLKMNKQVLNCTMHF